MNNTGGLSAPPVLETAYGSVPLNYSIEQVPEDSDGQVAATIARMSQYVCEDCQAGPVLYDAQQALLLNPNNPLDAIHQFARGRLKFKDDDATTRPFNWMLPREGEHYFVECLIRPVDVSLQFAHTGKQVEGDCDDFSMYCAALLKAIGIDCCFATVGANSKDPNVFSHVYVVAYWRGARIPMDCSHMQFAGQEFAPPNSGVKFAEWGIFDRSSYGLVGLAILAAGWFAWTNRNFLRGLFA